MHDSKVEVVAFYKISACLNFKLLKILGTWKQLLEIYLALHIVLIETQPVQGLFIV